MRCWIYYLISTVAASVGSAFCTLKVAGEIPQGHVPHLDRESSLLGEARLLAAGRVGADPRNERAVRLRPSSWTFSGGDRSTCTQAEHFAVGRADRGNDGHLG